MPVEAAPSSKSAEPLLRSAAAFKAFQEWKATQPQPVAPPAAATTPAAVPAVDPNDPYGLKTDPRSIKWPLEVMGCSRTTHKSYYTQEAYPMSRNILYAQVPP